MISNNETLVFSHLPAAEQAVIWSTFFMAIDEGCAGHHPLYGVLAPLYAAGDYRVAGDETLDCYDVPAAVWDAPAGDRAWALEDVEVSLDGVVPPF